MKFCVKNTINRGRGIFATRDIKRNELIGVINGPIVDDNEKLWNEYGGNHYFHPISYTKAIVGINQIKYCNHSCDPNCGIKNKTKIVAMKNISKNQELTIDYDTLDYNNKMRCYCGAKSCRKIIKGYKYLSPKLKNKYCDYIAEYLLKSPIIKSDQ